MITGETERAAQVNALLRKPYRLGASGPDEFDCYGLARHLQRELFGVECPLFEAPGEASRIGLAALIAAHPERANWSRIDRPRDGCFVSMAREGMAYHLGTYLGIDGGVIVHTLEDSGVTVDDAFALPALGWRSIKWWARKDLEAA